MESLQQLARVPRRPPRVDFLIAAGLFLWALLEALFVHGPWPTWVRVLGAVAFTAPLVVRRQAPLATLLVIVVAITLSGVLMDTPEEGANPFPPMLVATFSAALYQRPRQLAVAALALPLMTIAIAFVTGYFAGSPTPVDVAILAFFTVGAWTGGFLVRRRAAQLRHAQAAAPELARDAVVAERARVARELHDVVAHSVSTIAVQAGAAEALMGDAQPAAAAHVESIRRTAHETLDELRRLLGMLREDEASYEPAPGLAQLDDLADETRRAGVPVALALHGTRGPLPAGVELALYRIVQESLTNVRRHAGEAVATTVEVRVGERAVELEVVNGRAGVGTAGGASATGGESATGGADARGAAHANGASRPAAPEVRMSGEGTGYGLIGMRERARLYGGTLDAGATPDGGFRVRALLPLNEGIA